MTDVIALALARKAARPDIYVEIMKPESSRSGYGENVGTMIEDLKSMFPAMSIRQVSDFLGISTKPVRKVFAKLGVGARPDGMSPEDAPDADEFVPFKSNEEMCADELAALKATGEEGYGQDPRSRDEYKGGPILVPTPAFRDSYRRADQSHTFPKPITLPTFPFLPLNNSAAAA